MDSLNGLTMGNKGRRRVRRAKGARTIKKREEVPGTGRKTPPCITKEPQIAKRML
jgi:hypothetical protein